MDGFLIDRDPTTWSAPAGLPSSLTPAGVFVQEAPSGLEVTLVRAPSKPRAADLRDGWSRRRAGRASPVLLVSLVHQVFLSRKTPNVNNLRQF